MLIFFGVFDNTCSLF
jgi:hypothetical protein